MQVRKYSAGPVKNFSQKKAQFRDSFFFLRSGS